MIKVKSLLNTWRNVNGNGNGIPSALFRYISSSGKRVSHGKRSRIKARSKPAPITESFLNSILSSLPTRFTSSDLSSLLIRQPDPLVCLKVLTWFTHHPRFKPDPDPFVVTVKKLGAVRMFEEMDSVATLAMSLPGFCGSGLLFNTVIYFYLEAGRLAKAFHVYTVMRKSEDENVKPSTHTYNLLFTALINRSSRNSLIQYAYMDNVSALFRQMVESGIKPDLICLNSVIKGYVQSLHLNDALRVFHQMEPVYGIKPDGCTYSYLVHGLCAQGRTINARELFDEMTSKYLVLDWRASNSIVSALAIEGEIEEAKRVLWELGKVGRFVDGITCRCLIGQMVRDGRRREEVKNLVLEMEEKRVLEPRIKHELLTWIDEEFRALERMSSITAVENIVLESQVRV